MEEKILEHNNPSILASVCIETHICCFQELTVSWTYIFKNLPNNFRSTEDVESELKEMADWQMNG